MNIVVYGIGGADVQYCALRYKIVPWKCYKVLDQVQFEAQMMKEEYPSIKRIFAIYDRPGLAQAYRNSVFDKHNSIEARMAFLDMLERYGVELVIR